MRREDKFGYAFLLGGLGGPILIVVIFGEKFAASVVGSVFVSCAVLMLTLGHLHKEIPRKRGRMATLGLFVLGGALTGALAGLLIGISWITLRQNKEPEIGSTENSASSKASPPPVARGEGIAPPPSTTTVAAGQEHIVAPVPGPAHHAGEGFIQIYPTVKDAGTLLQQNESIAFVANYINKGQEPVRSFLPFASLMPIGEATDNPDMSRDAVWSKFHKQAKEYESRHPNRNGESVGPGDNWQVTVDGEQPLNQATIEAIRLGKVKILLVARAEWKTLDGLKGEIERCFVFIPPTQKNPTQLTWSSCDSL